MKIPALLVASLLAPVLVLHAGFAAAQDFPVKPVRIINISAPGGGSDLMARVIAPGMGAVLGQSVVVENMPGGTGLLANRHVAKQVAPDGYTLLVTATSTLAAPVFFKDPGYNFLADLAPISLLADTPFLLASNPSAPWSNFEGMVAYAKANPGKLNHGTGTQLDLPTLFMEGIRQKYGIKITDVGYKNGGAAFTRALAVDEVNLIFTSQAAVSASLQRGAKVIAVSGSRRVAAFKDAQASPNSVCPKWWTKVTCC